MRKLWLDDERVMPLDYTGEDDWATTSIQAINQIRNRTEYGETYEEISLDHDLGGEDTGMAVLDWMIENGVWPKRLVIHTANPPARQNMLRAANASAPPEVEIYIKTW
jgi:hypothetical protein